MAQRGLLGGGDEGCAGEGNPWRCACEQDLDAEQGKSGKRKAESGKRKAESGKRKAASEICFALISRANEEGLRRKTNS